MRTGKKPAFTLVELVIVVVIIAILVAIAIPRITRSAQNSSASALSADLRNMRSAIEQYRVEHDGNPPTVANFVSQLTQFSDNAGTSFADAADYASGIIYGPYLQAIPPLPIGAKTGKTTVAAAAGADVGWVYDAATGKIIAGSADTEKDKAGVAYNTY